MERTATLLPGVFLLHEASHTDARGSFERIWSLSEAAVDHCRVAEAALERGSLTEAAIDHAAAAGALIQVSLARNPQAGTVRGLHFAIAPQRETKYVRCLAGRLYDVVVDLRPGSATAGQFIGVELGPQTMQTLCIPPGCAHGYQTLEPDTVVLYGMDAPYLDGCVRVLQYNDPVLAVPWPQPVSLIADHDLCGLTLSQALEACMPLAL